MQSLNKKVLLPGIVGSLGALIIVIVDIIYNLFNGNHLGTNLYITFLGLFIFPLWWGGIWVIYQGLKPAGVLWSLIPCIIFVFYTSTINVFYHSCYPFWAAINDSSGRATGETLNTIINIKATIKGYTSLINIIDSMLQLIICVWIAIPVLRGKTHFPRWIAFLIPIFPMIACLIINIFIKGFFNMVEPYIASGFICILFILCTSILHKKFANVFKA
ncbi:MAG: hypothetical protein Q8936_22410 [Bacillota bacterium]|nr:hypothetical protein [Bacillota bacterium]